jgi:hypothetical protein
MTKEKALEMLATLPAYQQLGEKKQKNCNKVLDAWYQVRAETPSHQRVLVTAIVKKLGSSSNVYRHIALIRAVVGDGVDPAPVEESLGDAGHQLPPEFSSLFAPILKQIEAFPEALGRIYASKVANEINHCRASFAQERASLVEASAEANSQIGEHEQHAISLAEKNDQLESLLEAAVGENSHLAEQAAASNLKIDAVEIRQHAAAARIIEFEKVDKDRQLEVADFKQRLEEMANRATQAEEERRSVAQLRETDGERFRTELADIRSEHLQELAVLRAELERQFAAERDRIKFDLAIVAAFKSAVNTNTASEKEASDV